MLRQKCDSEDEILPTLDRLCADHAQVRSSLKGVMAGLHRTMEAHQGLSPQETETCKTFAALKLRHVILENAIVLPIARVRLSRRDLQDLSDRMLRRRRLDRLAGGVNAG